MRTAYFATENVLPKRRSLSSSTGARTDTGRATAAGAGILSRETAKRDDPAWVEFVLAAGRHYDALLPRLGPDIGWARCGILQLATRDSDVLAWEWVAERAIGATEVSPDEARQTSRLRSGTLLTSSFRLLHLIGS